MDKSIDDPWKSLPRDDRGRATRIARRCDDPWKSLPRENRNGVCSTQMSTGSAEATKRAAMDRPRERSIYSSPGPKATGMGRLAPYGFWLGLAACGSASTATALPKVPRLAKPSPIDPALPGAAYLTKIAMQLQPGWSQFLNDCRLRLPPSHALNQLQLAATVEMAIDPSGGVQMQFRARSGAVDFDRAVEDAIRDSAPFPWPPTELLGDDNRAHLRWLFARDHRQAGPATAEITHFELPLAEVVGGLVSTGDLARAAHRIATEKPGTDRDSAIALLMVAALGEAVRSDDGAVKRAAIDAIAQARVTDLAPEVRHLLTATLDPQLRVAALNAVGDLEDRAAIPAILSQLPSHLETRPELARAAARTLARLGNADAAADAIYRSLMGDNPSYIALEAFVYAPAPRVERRLDGWLKRGDPKFRAAVCAALPAVPFAHARILLQKGLTDPDATVRTACTVAAAHAALAAHTRHGPLIGRIRALTRDPDRAVRVSAIRSLAALDPLHTVDTATDPAAEIRAAYAGLPSATNANLRALLDDRDPEVRAAAWTTLTAARPGFPQRAQLALLAMADPAPQVRSAALGSLEDEAALNRIAGSDETPEVRTAALVELTRQRGRLRCAAMLLQRFASAPAISVERVRIALAWLIAR